MKNHLNDMQKLEKSRVTSFGQFMLSVGFIFAVMFAAFEVSPIYRQLAMIALSLGFPSLLAGLVCDTLIRIHNTQANHWNSKD